MPFFLQQQLHDILNFLVWQLDGVEYRKNRGRPKGSKDRKPRVRSSIVDSKMQCETKDVFIRREQLVAQSPAWPNCVGTSCPEKTKAVPLGQCESHQNLPSLPATHFSTAAASSTLLPSVFDAECSWTNLAGPMSIIGDTVDPFHADWAYW